MVRYQVVIYEGGLYVENVRENIRRFMEMGIKKESAMRDFVNRSRYVALVYLMSV